MLHPPPPKTSFLPELGVGHRAVSKPVPEGKLPRRNRPRTGPAPKHGSSRRGHRRGATTHRVGLSSSQIGAPPKPQGERPPTAIRRSNMNQKGVSAAGYRYKGSNGPRPTTRRTRVNRQNRAKPPSNWPADRPAPVPKGPPPESRTQRRMTSSSHARKHRRERDERIRRNNSIDGDEGDDFQARAKRHLSRNMVVRKRSSTSRTRGGQSRVPRPSAPPPRDQPGGYITKHWDEEAGRSFYHNSLTGMSSWENPLLTTERTIVRAPKILPSTIRGQRLPERSALSRRDRGQPQPPYSGRRVTAPRRNRLSNRDQSQRQGLLRVRSCRVCDYQPLEPDALFCVACGASQVVRKIERSCECCGNTLLSEDALFCDFCGSSLPEVGGPLPEQIAGLRRRNRAAKTMQSLQRGFKARQRAQLRREAALNLQGAFRRHLASPKHQRRRKGWKIGFERHRKKERWDNSSRYQRERAALVLQTAHRARVNRLRQHEVERVSQNLLEHASQSEIDRERLRNRARGRSERKKERLKKLREMQRGQDAIEQSRKHRNHRQQMHSEVRSIDNREDVWSEAENRVIMKTTDEEEKVEYLRKKEKKLGVEESFVSMNGETNPFKWQQNPMARGTMDAPPPRFHRVSAVAARHWAQVRAWLNRGQKRHRNDRRNTGISDMTVRARNTKDETKIELNETPANVTNGALISVAKPLQEDLALEDIESDNAMLTSSTSESSSSDSDNDDIIKMSDVKGTGKMKNNIVKTRTVESKDRTEIGSVESTPRKTKMSLKLKLTDEKREKIEEKSSTPSLLARSPTKRKINSSGLQLSPSKRLVTPASHKPAWSPSKRLISAEKFFSPAGAAIASPSKRLVNLRNERPQSPSVRGAAARAGARQEPNKLRRVVEEEKNIKGKNGFVLNSPRVTSAALAAAKRSSSPKGKRPSNVSPTKRKVSTPDSSVGRKDNLDKMKEPSSKGQNRKSVYFSEDQAAEVQERVQRYRQNDDSSNHEEQHKVAAPTSPKKGDERMISSIPMPPPTPKPDETWQKQEEKQISSFQRSNEEIKEAVEEVAEAIETEEHDESDENTDLINESSKGYKSDGKKGDDDGVIVKKKKERRNDEFSFSPRSLLKMNQIEGSGERRLPARYTKIHHAQNSRGGEEEWFTSSEDPSSEESSSDFSLDS